MTNILRLGACVAGLLAASPATAQRIELVDDARLPRFDVASVKPGDPGSEPPPLSVTPGRIVQENVPLWNVISLAFDVRPSQLTGQVPNAAVQERFTVEGRMPVTTTTTDLKLMLRALLIDRFKLRVHVESREQDAYALMLARRDGQLGPRLQPSRVDCRARTEAQARNQPVPPLPTGSKPCAFNAGPGSLTMAGWPITTLMAVLGQAGRPVIDNTGLPGTFDVELRWAPDAGAAAGDAPSLFTAVQEQLGLKLEPARTTVDYLVIDHVERPSPD